MLPQSTNEMKEIKILRKPVNLVTNIREVVMAPITTINRYGICIQYFYKNREHITVSTSRRSGTLLEQDKLRCQYAVHQVFSEVQLADEQNQSIIYDGQRFLYTFRPLLKTNWQHVLKENVSNDPWFREVKFRLETPQSVSKLKMKDARKHCPLLLNALSTIIDAMMSEDVFRFQDVVYLRDGTKVGLREWEIREGGLKAYAGIKTSVKKGKANKVFVSHDVKFDLFHPDTAPLLDLMQSFSGFSLDLDSNSEAGRRISKALSGVSFYLSFLKPMAGDETVMNIEGFSSNTTLSYYGQRLTVAQFFEEHYKIKLKFPNLMSIVTTTKYGRKLYYPPELVSTYLSQKVTNERMTDGDREALREWSLTTPKVRHELIGEMIKVMIPDSAARVVSFGETLKIEGEVIRRPTVMEPVLSVTPLPVLLEWNIAFTPGKEVEGLDDIYMEQFVYQGMAVNRPKIVWIKNGDLERLLSMARRNRKQLMILVMDLRLHDLAQVRWMEYKYNVPCTVLSPDYARRLIMGEGSPRNVAQECIRRIIGINPMLFSYVFCRNDQLVIGISISQPAFKQPDKPLTIGCSFNGLPDHRLCTSSFLYTYQDVFNSGLQINGIVNNAIRTVLRNRNVLPSEVLIYFDGISEDQYYLVSEIFKKCILEVFVLNDMETKCDADLILLVATRDHNEQFFKTDEMGNIMYAKPGTVIDHTVVSPDFEEFYHFGPGFAITPSKKPTKYTVLFNAHPLDLEKLETITNDLCYAHEHEFPDMLCVPAPLEMAKREAIEGARILERDGTICTNGNVSIYQTNKQFVNRHVNN